MKNEYDIVEHFENELGRYVGCKHAIAVDSCTNAIFLCCKYLNVGKVTFPNQTYVSVPLAVMHAGGQVEFENLRWCGKYQLQPYPIWDFSSLLERDMYEKGTYQCISFSNKKAINIGKGGMIFCDDDAANEWFRLARYSGRSCIPYKEETNIKVAGWNMYMTPEQAARGLSLLRHLPLTSNSRVSYEDYNDISKFEVFNGS